MTVPTNRRRARRARELPLLAWPIGLVLLLIALGAWRAGADERSAAPAAAAAPVLAARAFGDLRLPIPTRWQTLDRGGERVTWGSSDRRHTVTLASTEASTLPLVAIVGEVARQSSRDLEGTRVVTGPTRIEPAEPIGRDDAVVFVEFEVVESSRTLQVVQTWRRDARAGIDIVATWTSSDGSWPADPRRSIPTVGG